MSIEEYLRFVQCLRKDRLYIWELYARLSVYTALRCSDVRSLKWIDILDKPSFIKTEKKTGKSRTIHFDKEKRKVISQLYVLLGNPDVNGYIFNLKNNKPVSSQYINQKLKTFRVKYQLKIQNFSTHTFRKTFARYFYEQSNDKGGALIILCALLNHSSITNTKIYLNIQQEDIQNAYMAFPA